MQHQTTLSVVFQTETRRSIIDEFLWRGLNGDFEPQLATDIATEMGFSRQAFYENIDILLDFEIIEKVGQNSNTRYQPYAQGVGYSTVEMLNQVLEDQIAEETTTNQYQTYTVDLFNSKRICKIIDFLLEFTRNNGPQWDNGPISLSKSEIADGSNVVLNSVIQSMDTLEKYNLAKPIGDQHSYTRYIPCIDQPPLNLLLKVENTLNPK